MNYGYDTGLYVIPRQGVFFFQSSKNYDSSIFLRLTGRGEIKLENWKAEFAERKLNSFRNERLFAIRFEYFADLRILNLKCDESFMVPAFPGFLSQCLIIYIFCNFEDADQ